MSPCLCAKFLSQSKRDPLDALPKKTALLSVYDRTQPNLDPGKFTLKLGEKRSCCRKSFYSGNKMATRKLAKIMLNCNFSKELKAIVTERRASP